MQKYPLLIWASRGSGREIDAAFESLAREKVDGLFVAAGAFYGARRVQPAALAASYTGFLQPIRNALSSKPAG